jgi:hypothetical protein
LHALRRPIRAEHDLFDVGGVGHHGDDDVAQDGDVARAGDGPPPGSHERLAASRAAVVGDDPKPRAEHVLGHRSPHDAEPDPADAEEGTATFHVRGFYRSARSNLRGYRLQATGKDSANPFR